MIETAIHYMELTILYSIVALLFLFLIHLLYKVTLSRIHFFKMLIRYVICRDIFNKWYEKNKNKDPNQFLRTDKIIEQHEKTSDYISSLYKDNQLDLTEKDLIKVGRYIVNVHN